MKKVLSLRKIFLTLFFVVFVAIASMPSPVSAQSTVPGCTTLTTTGLEGVVKCLVSIFNNLIYLMIAATVVYTIYGAFLMVSDEEKREAGKQMIYYGIIGVFVMISVWGFVNILDKTFNLSNSKSLTPKSLFAP